MKTLKQTIEAKEKQYLTKLMEIAATNNEAARISNLTRTQMFRLLEKHSIPRKEKGNK